MDSVLFESLISYICVALNCYLFIHISFHMLNAGYHNNLTPTLGPGALLLTLLYLGHDLFHYVITQDVWRPWKHNITC